MKQDIEDDIPVRLVFEPENRLIVTFPHGLKGKAEFSKEAHMFEEVFEDMGIVIPIEDRKEYPELENESNRSAIYLDDQSFGKAFYEVFYPASLDRTKFTWHKL